MAPFRDKRIFLDYASGTPTSPHVLRAMRELEDHFHNPSAIYKEGQIAKEEVSRSRRDIARILGARESGIIFTSGGTESDNLAILGTFSACEFAKPHLITSPIEHHAILETVKEVSRRGGEVSFADVSEVGLVSPQSVEKLLRPETFLVSIGLANGEIGTIQDVSKIGRIIRAYRKEKNSPYPYFHVDLGISPNYLPVDLDRLHADLLTLDGGKIYGPKGVGVLALRHGVKINPIIFGGGQEGGKRSGTLNLPAIKGLSEALMDVEKKREGESERAKILQDYFLQSIESMSKDIVINTPKTGALPCIVSVSLPGTLSEFLALKLDRLGVLASVGSACSADGLVSGSHVMREIGKGELAESTLRFSFGRGTRKRDLDSALQRFSLVIKHDKI